MAELPRPSGKEMARFLQHQGFSLLRVRGSHHFFGRGDARTSVPIHGNETLKIGTLRSILRDVAMTPTRFAELWEKQRAMADTAPLSCYLTSNTAQGQRIDTW